MDRIVIERKLDSLQRCLVRIRERCPPDIQTLTNDIDTQDILSLNLTSAVQLCVDLATHLLAATQQPMPETMGLAFEILARIKIIPEDLALRLRRLVGFRNLTVHNYNYENLGRECCVSRRWSPSNADITKTARFTWASDFAYRTYPDQFCAQPYRANHLISPFPYQRKINDVRIHYSPKDTMPR
ncbi:hypothetical protein CCP3SC1_1640002 [Gammaproteobacteria bacterium]